MPPGELRLERIVVETDRYRVEGDVRLPQEGYRSRISDYINRPEQQFITLINVELRSIDGSGRDWDTPILMLSRRHIRLIVPTSEDV